MRTKIFALFAAVFFTGSMFAATEMTCAQAREAALGGSTDEVTVTGYVTSIQTAYNAQYNNLTFWMADEVDGGKVFQAYRCIPESADKLPEVGNLVKATGTLYNFNGNTPELAQGCTCVIVENDTLEEPCVTASGTCGANLTWELSCDSVLTISGTGAMEDYRSSADVPWDKYRRLITSLIIGDDVTSLSQYAFLWCYRLPSVTIPKNITKIESRAFHGCSGLTSIVVESGNTTYDSRDNCNAIIETATNMLITGCQTTIIPNSVTAIGASSFDGCESLITIEIPNSVKSIGEFAFRECYGLMSINIPESVTRIDYAAFVGCKSLVSIAIPKNVTYIGSAAFGACSSLTSIDVETDNPNYCSIDGVLFNKDQTKLIQYPGGKHGEYVIPNSVTCIGYEALRSDSLTSVTIPNSVTIIEDDAFELCKSMTSVTNYATTPQEINSNVFYRVDISACTLYVPAESLEAYKTADVWKDFGTILPIEEVEKDYISIAEAIEIGMALDSMATSAETYTIEGYVINADAFYKYYKDQSWYMADDMEATSSDFQAYLCYPIFGEDTVEVTNGSKVRMTGKLLKYYNRTTEKYIVEMKQVPATILSWPQKDTITVAQALEIGSTLESMAVTEKEYVIKGYVSNIVVPYDTLYKNETFWITDEKGARTSDKTQAFEIYRGKPNTEMEIGLDAYIQIKCKIMNYRGIIENDGTNQLFKVLEQGVIEIPDTITVAQALEIGTALESMEVTEKEYVIKGYVSNIITPYDTIYKNETFMITDVKGARTNDITQAFEIYRGRPNTQKEIGLDAYIQIKCRIKNYKGIIENEAANQSFEVLEQGIIDDNPDSCIIASGTCGENLTWELSCDSVLTISGTGEMEDYDYTEVTNIPWYEHHEAIKSVIIGDGVTSIGEWAFYYYKNLTSVTISNSVTSIGGAAFSDCFALASVTIPNSVTSIGEDAFAFTTGLISITVAEDNQQYCSEDGVLFNKDKTTLVQYPAGRTATSYIIPNSVTSLRTNAFCHSHHLTSIEIPNGVTYIGVQAFYYCSGLTSIEIPSSVTYIGGNALRGCSGLASMVVASGNPIFDSRDNSNAIIRTETNTLIVGCKNTIIPNSVTSIGYGAFIGCSGLTSIEIPNSVTSIGKEAFSSCKDLTSVINYAIVPQTINADVFGYITLSACTLYVPAESLEVYKAADVWKDFGTILPIEVPVETEEVDFNVVYKGNDGSQISSEMITLHLPVAPEIEGFSFLKWEVVAGDLEDGIVIQAVYTSNEQSALSVVVNPSNPAQKLIRNGNVYILTGDKIYTIQGQEVR